MNGLLSYCVSKNILGQYKWIHTGDYGWRNVKVRRAVALWLLRYWLTSIGGSLTCFTHSEKNPDKISIKRERLDSGTHQNVTKRVMTLRKYHQSEKNRRFFNDILWFKIWISLSYHYYYFYKNQLFMFVMVDIVAHTQLFLQYAACWLIWLLDQWWDTNFIKNKIHMYKTKFDKLKMN